MTTFFNLLLFIGAIVVVFLIIYEGIELWKEINK
nr:MAG TPA: transmembrane protein [Caudoviricetes sp.]